MRVAEILMLSTNLNYTRQLFRDIGSEVIDENEKVVFGVFAIDEQLQIHLYAFEWQSKSSEFIWDVVCRKSLGVIILFDWRDTESVQQMKEITNYFDAHFELPVVVASWLNGEGDALPTKLYRGGLPVTQKSRFVFFNMDNPAALRELLVDLININLESLVKEK